MVSSKQSVVKPHTSAQMFPLIRAWEESGKSQKEFCAGRGIKAHLFYYWLKRYRVSKQAISEAGPGFVALEVAPVPEAVVLAEIVYSNGTRLVLKERVGVDFLRALLINSL